MQGTGGFTILIGILASLLWVKFFKDQSDGSPSSILLPISATVTVVVSFVVWIIRRKD